jgi:hypothetical protein
MTKAVAPIALDGKYRSASEKAVWAVRCAGTIHIFAWRLAPVAWCLTGPRSQHRIFNFSILPLNNNLFIPTPPSWMTLKL